MQNSFFSENVCLRRRFDLRLKNGKFFGGKISNLLGKFFCVTSKILFIEKKNYHTIFINGNPMINIFSIEPVHGIA